jgi:hypothetical protein
MNTNSIGSSASLSMSHLTARADELNKAVDHWNHGMLWSLALAALAACAVLVTTRMVLFRAKQLNEVQAQLLKAKDNELARNLKDKDLKIAEANERANVAALELEKFKAPRFLSSAGQSELAEAMKQYTGVTFDGGIGPLNDPEPQHLFDSIAQALLQAGWRQVGWKEQSGFVLGRTGGRPALGGVSVTNVIIDIHPQQSDRLWPIAQSLASTLQAFGVAAQAQQGSGGTNENPEAIHILIGRKL